MTCLASSRAAPCRTAPHRWTDIIARWYATPSAYIVSQPHDKPLRVAPQKNFIIKDVKTGTGRNEPSQNRAILISRRLIHGFFCTILVIFSRVRFSCERFKETAYRVSYRMSVILGGQSARRRRPARAWERARRGAAALGALAPLCAERRIPPAPAASASHDIIDVTAPRTASRPIQRNYCHFYCR